MADKPTYQKPAYGRYRDNVSDSQWQYGTEYQSYRDDVGDSQWQKSYDRSVYESDRDYNYQKSRDKVADSQWAKEYQLSKKSAASSGGSSGGGYIGGGSGDNALSNYWKAKDDVGSAVSGRAKRNPKALNANKSRPDK